MTETITTADEAASFAAYAMIEATLQHYINGALKGDSALMRKAEHQGRSGLGLEAQQSSVRDYLSGGSWSLVAELTEVETGKKADRPELQKALALCRKHKAKLVIARPSRNLAFIAVNQR
jgi:hypothetical protein